MKFTNGDRVEVHIKSIDRWRPATVLTAYPGHGGHMVITDGGRRLHAKRGDMRTPGEGERIAPDPHDTAYQGEVGDHQPHSTQPLTMFLSYDQQLHIASVDDILKRDPNYGHDTGGSFTKPRNTEPGVPTPPNPVVTLGDIHNKIGPFTTSTLENAHFAKKYGHVHKGDELSMRTPENAPGITAHEAYDTLKESLKEFAHRVTSLGMPTEADNVARYETARTDASNKYGVSYKDQSLYLDALESFMQAGVTPETLYGYVAALGRFNAYGFTPDDLERLTTEKFRENYAAAPKRRDTIIPNIAAAYKETK